MSFDDWLTKFASLHDRARAGKLTTSESRGYLAARNELARVLLKKQRKNVPAGAKDRQLLRAQIALPVEVHLPGSPARALTQELWTGGFSAIVPPLGVPTDRLRFVLTLAKDQPPIEGWARVLTDAAAGGSTRLTVEFEGLSPADAERVELAVFDAVLAWLRPAVP